MYILAYTYDADVHCPACTLHNFHIGQLTMTRPSANDEHGVPLTLIDREGNPVHPVFTTDEHSFTHCGDCGEEIDS